MAKEASPKTQLKLVSHPPRQETPIQDFFVPEEFAPSIFEWKKWLFIALVTLLWHILLAYFHPTWNTPLQPPPIDLQKIDPNKLDAIRRQWDKKEKQFLLNKNKSTPTSEEAAPDARYMSDRNRRVKEEQRAKETNVIPNSGRSQRRIQNPSSSPQQKSKTLHQRPIPKLGNLGVPLHLTSKPPEEVTEDQAGTPSQPVGDQTIQDPQLREGAENLLNTQESIYYSFYARIYESIGPIWQSLIREVPQQRSIKMGNYSTVVDVVFDDQGNLVGIYHLQDSGVTEFDRAVDRAWKRIGRFPNPPKGLLDAHRQVHMGWTFTVQVGAGFNVDSAPPRRDY